MTGLSVVLQFAGAVALLLWSVRTIRGSVARAFGTDRRSRRVQNCAAPASSPGHRRAMDARPKITNGKDR